jgi:hypothetical protein
MVQAFRAAALAAALVLGCGGGKNQNAASSGSGGGTAGSTASSSGSSSSGGGAPAHGPPATQTVSAGARAQSASYVMVFTMGQPTQNQDRASSKSYVLQGGLVGANGSLP